MYSYQDISSDGYKDRALKVESLGCLIVYFT